MERLQDFFGQAVGINYNFAPAGLILREPGVDLYPGMRDMGEQILEANASQAPIAVIKNAVFHTRPRADNTQLYNGWIEGTLMPPSQFPNEKDTEEIGFSPFYSSFSDCSTYESVRRASWVSIEPDGPQMLAVGAV